MADAAPGERTPLDPLDPLDALQDASADSAADEAEAPGPASAESGGETGETLDPRPGDYYATLGVSAQASLEDIKRAYHREAKRWHPDRFANADLALYARAGRRMRQLTEAYRALSDPSARAVYDATLRGDGATATGAGGVSSSIVGGYPTGVAVERGGEHASRNPNGAGQFFAALALVVGLSLLVGVSRGGASNIPLVVIALALVIALGIIAALFLADSPASRWASGVMEGEPRGYTPRPTRRPTSRAGDGVRFTTAAQAGPEDADGAKAFERMVADALVSVPDQFEPYMRNIVVEVEDEPSAATLLQAGVPEGYTLLGLYRGVPLDKRGIAETAPDVITIFRGPIERHCGGDPDRIRDQVRATTLHELAHHFGIVHEEMPDWVK